MLVDKSAAELAEKNLQEAAAALKNAADNAAAELAKPKRVRTAKPKPVVESLEAPTPVEAPVVFQEYPVSALMQAATTECCGDCTGKCGKPAEVPTPSWTQPKNEPTTWWNKVKAWFKD